MALRGAWLRVKVLENRIVIRQLLRDQRLPPAIKVTHQLLCLHPKDTIVANAKLFNMRYDVLRRRVRRLQQLDWAYEFPHPETRRPVIVPFMPLTVEQMVADELQRGRNDTPYWGEWILGRWLDLIVDDDDYVDNARPESLVSGFGSYRMEVDYLFRGARVGIEFQGKHHFEAGPSKEEQEKLKRQQERDALKSLLCVRQDIAFVEIIGRDLSYETLVSKLGRLLPLIPPRKDRPLFRALSAMTHSYVNNLNR